VSIALMTAVWKLDLPPSDKMVLLALADAANDDGVTWMAVQSRNAGKMDLLNKCSLSLRAVQGAIKRLCASGHLSRNDRTGKGVIWTVTPAADAPRQDMRPAANAGPPAANAGKPSLNHQPSSEAKASSDDTGAKVEPFDRFWTAYPSKIGKGLARKAYADAITKARKAGATDPHALMLTGLAKATASARWKDPTYTIPNPATWLNQERWDDEPCAVIAKSGGATVTPSAMSPELIARRRALLEQAPEQPNA